MNFKLFILLILVLPYVSANDEWIYKTSSFDILTHIESSIEIKEESSSSILDYVKAELYFVPQQNERQKVSKLITSPTGEQTENSILFTWKNPEIQELDFELNAELTVQHYLPMIRKKIPFPIQNLDNNLLNYTQPTKLIDSQEQSIVLLSSSLASGREDLYDVVFSISDWVLENINYSLTTATEKVTQKASWTLDKKYGVCDEITTLFIALCRTLGIPARYVGGLAYTNYNELNDFGPHAWAEVYFPSVGWVPYDITYGEFGFIDGTHIELKQYQDPEESSTRYEWRGRNVDTKTNKLEMKANILSFGSTIPPPIRIKTSVLKENVGFGSYNLIIAEIQNLNTYYVSISIAAAKSDEIELFGKQRKHHYLKPLETKKVYWIVRVDNNLNTDYIYTFPFAVYSLENISDSRKFTAQDDAPVFNYDYMKDIMDEQLNEEKKTYSHNVQIMCTTNASYYYINEDVPFICEIKNTGNVLLQNLKVCFESDCHKYNLGINQAEQLEFNAKYSTEAENNAKVTATNNMVSKAVFVPITVYSIPNIELSNLEYPAEVTYKQKYQVTMLINKTTKADAQNIRITLTKGDLSKEWQIENLQNSQEFSIELQGSDLRINENIFNLRIGYKDKNNNQYHHEKTFSIKLVDVSIFQRIAIFLKQIDLKLQKGFAKLLG
jgi:hypothetical protein